MITPKRFFVTGTGTGVGKTLVAAMLVTGMENAIYWKPIQCGTEHGTDTHWVQRITGLPDSRCFPETHCFKHPLSPHAAASQAGVRIDLNDFKPPGGDRPWIVEGAGGIMVPLNEKDMILDLIEMLSLPVLLVARSNVGTLNHTLLSLEALKRRRIDIIGVIMNGIKNPSNKQAIEYYGKTRVLLEIEPLGEISRDVLAELFKEMRL